MTENTVHILLVEDDEVDVKAVRRAFKALRIANPIVVAKDGLEALEILRSNGRAEAGTSRTDPGPINSTSPATSSSPIPPPALWKPSRC